MTLATLGFAIFLPMATIAWLVVILSEDELDRAMFNGEAPTIGVRLSVPFVVLTYWPIFAVSYALDDEVGRSLYRMDSAWDSFKRLLAVMVFGVATPLEDLWDDE